MHKAVQPFNFGDIGLEQATLDWGFSRGSPVDRHYIEEFLARNASDIQGNVLEVGDNVYTLRFGGDRVTKSDVIDIRPRNPKATFVDDLTNATTVPSAAFDCIICAQVLELIRETKRAIDEMCRLLKPGGVALITVPGISHISPLPSEAEAWSWSFYPNTFRWLLSQSDFEVENITIESHGNLKTTVAFLAGLAQQDLAPGDYDMNDLRFPLIVTARVVKRRVTPTNGMPTP